MVLLRYCLSEQCGVCDIKKLCFCRYASRVKLITNDAQKNSDNKEIARLKNVRGRFYLFIRRRDLLLSSWSTGKDLGERVSLI